MSFKKLWTALKGGVNEATEAAADSQAIRILDQEMREADQELTKAKTNLTTIMGKRKVAENKVRDLQSEVEKYTAHAVSASESGNDDLALECAERVAGIEADMATEQSMLDSFVKSETALKTNIKKIELTLRRNKQQVDQVKAMDAVQKAQASISTAAVGAGNKTKTAMDSLDRIKAKQAERAGQLEAAEEIAMTESGADLDSKLQAAGVAPGGSVAASDKLAAILAAKKQ